jgi:hypothetical protein
MDKTFRYAGIARDPSKEGVLQPYKVRFANSAQRIRLMQSSWGYRDVDLIELEHAMTKTEAVDYLIRINFAGKDSEAQQCLESAQQKRTKARVPKSVDTSEELELQPF